MRVLLIMSIGLWIFIALPPAQSASNDFEKALPTQSKDSDALKRVIRLWDERVLGQQSSAARESKDLIRSIGVGETRERVAQSPVVGTDSVVSQKHALERSEGTDWEDLFRRWDAIVRGTELASMQGPSKPPEPSLSHKEGKSPRTTTRSQRPQLTSRAKRHPKGIGALEVFMAALSAVESKGSYSIQNPDSGALGKYQILPDNWDQWCREYTRARGQKPRGLPLTPENQEQIARFKLRQYYLRYRNWRDVASVWYCGRPFSQVVQQGWADVPQGKYLSVREYVERVMARFGQ